MGMCILVCVQLSFSIIVSVLVHFTEMRPIERKWRAMEVKGMSPCRTLHTAVCGVDQRGWQREKAAAFTLLFMSLWTQQACQIRNCSIKQVLKKWENRWMVQLWSVGGMQSWGKGWEMVLCFYCKPRSFPLLSSSFLLETWGKSH